MSIADCLKKHGIDAKHEDVILKGFAQAVDDGQLDNHVEATNALQEALIDAENERADIMAQIAPKTDNKANQVKSAIGNKGQFSKSNDDIRFSKSEVERTLIAQHNLSVSNLIHADRMGALAAPSIAITDKAHPLTGFGEITLLADEDFVNGARTFGADIYSTRYPTIRYKFTVKDADKLNEMFKGEMDRIGDTSQFYPDSFGYDPHQTLKEIPAVAMKFLEAEGIKPKIKYVKARTKPDAIFNKWVKSSLDKYGLSNDDAFIADVKVQYKEQFKDVDKLMPSTDEAWRNVARNRADDIVRYRESVRDKGKLDLDATRNSMVEQIRLHKKMYKFEGYINSVINEINPKQRISDKNGNKQIEHTLDNVIRNMRSNFVGGENFGLGLGKIRSPHAPEFKSIAQIRKNKQRLMTSEDFGAVVKEVDKELHELSSRVNEYGTYTGYDNVEQAIFDSAKMGISRALTYNGFKNVPDDVKLEIEQFISKLRNMPTEYFEAKVLRGVGIGEFKAAVVPKDIAPEALAILKKNGITDIRMYKPGSSEDRFKQINSVKHVMFSRAPKLYSKLEQALESANDKVFSTGPQVKLWLQSNAGKLGIKKDEIYWSGIDNWLDAQGKVTKQQVVEFVRQNGVKVEDVTLGETRDNRLEVETRVDELATQQAESILEDNDWQPPAFVDEETDDEGNVSYVVYGGEYTNTYDSLAAAEAEADSINDSARDDALSDIKNNLNYDDFSEEVAEELGLVPKHDNSQLTLPGGTDYKELVVTVPTIEPHNANDSTHFGDTGGGRQIGWIRMDTRDGGLFIEELQSQRAQQGRSRGFLNNDNTSVNAELGELYNKVHDVDGYKVVFYNDVGIPRKQVKEVIGFKKYADKFWTDEQYDSRLDGAMPSGKPAQFDGVPLAEHLTSTPVWETWHDEVIKLRELSAKLRLSVPPAPFVSDANNKATNAYITLLMKKALIEAVSNDHDSVSWTTGEQQADRYDLSKQIGRVTYTDDKTLRAYDVNDDRIQVINQQLNDDKELVDYIGKDAAEKLLTQPARKNGKRELSGLALKTGGEWAQSMYGNEQGLDAKGKPSLMSQAANDIFKHVGSGKVESINGQPGFYVTPEMKGKDLPLFSRAKTIIVDGIERPTTNSEGKPIYNPVNFWRWFGDSEAVDEQGRPLVFYHGTKSDFNEFVLGSPGTNSTVFGPWETKRAGMFFTQDKKFAESFAIQGESDQDANVIPVYLKIENAIDLTSGFTDDTIIDALADKGINPRLMRNISADQIWGMFDEEDEGTFFVSKLKELGYDGAIIVEPNTATDESVESWVVFNPNQIKSAIGNNGDYSSTNNDIRFSFAGPKAETADKYALDTAQQRMAAGEDADTVRQDTGWFKGVDDKWRFEINDSDASIKKPFPTKGQRFGDVYKSVYESKLKNGYPGIALGDILDHPKLFAAYPNLVDLSVDTQKGDGASYRVSTSLSPSMIQIGEDVPMSEVLSVLLHEVQHGIQTIEGFASGGSANDKSLPTFLDIGQKINDRYAKQKEAIQLSSEYKNRVDEIVSSKELPVNRNGEPSLALAQRNAEIVADKEFGVDALEEDRQSEVDTFLNEEKQANAINPRYAGYKRLAGEVEARNTQLRMGMSEAERAASSPKDTQDVPDSDQIIVYNGVEMRSEPIPTITVDGIERPTENSEGKSIYNPVNFWRWFGDSKVVDKQGRPLVVYRGDSPDKNEFTGKGKGIRLPGNIFFTDNKSIGNSYAKDRELYSVYLKVIDPYAVDAKHESWLEIPAPREIKEEWGNPDKTIQIDELAAWSRNKGSDGLIVKNVMDQYGDGTQYAVFNPNQIKSATGNNGDYSSTNNDIRFSKEPERFGLVGARKENVQTPPTETRFRKFQRMNQDSFNRFTVIKEWLAKNGQKLSDKADVYGAEERYHSKVANQLEDFREKQRNPLIEKIQKAGYTLGDIEVFLKMQHAQEANEAIRKLGGDTAYGVTDEEAAEYLAESPKELATLANELRDITEQTKQLRLDAGILNTDITGAWENTYKHYIPVKGDADEKRGVGKGLKVNFKSKRRLGHSLRDEHVIENILMDHERAIMEVEKNRVGKHLVMMAAEMQMSNIISIAEPEKRKVLKTDTAYTVEANGVVQGVFASQSEAKTFKQLYATTYPNVAPSAIVISQTKDQRVIATASPMLAENEINVYMNGHAIRVQINDELLARAYTKLGVEQFSDIVAAGRILNGYLSKVYTGYNPEFILTNIQRDFTSGAINLTGEQGFVMATKAIANYPRMFGDLLKYAATNGKSSTEWIDSYRANGGNTGAAYLSDMERLGNEVSAEYASYQGVLSNLKQGDTVNAARAAGRKAFNLSLKWIYNLNQAGENAMRLAAYKSMIDSGRTVNEAAKVAKNITVNFNRKGERQSLPALYLFYNATIQGTAAVAHALTKGKHKHQAQALAAGMVGLGYLAASSLGGGDEDDWEKINDYTKERNLLIKSDEGYFKLPVPYGYGFFYNLGRHISEAQRTGELGALPWHLATSALSEFTPLNDTVVGADEEFKSDQVFMGLLPTAMKIPAQPIFNKQLFTGSELMPDSPFYKSQPDREKMFRGTKGTMYDTVAGWLEAAGMDVSPETLKYIVRTGTGGAGSLVDTAISAVMLKKEGATLDTAEIPFVRKAYMELTIKDTRAAFNKAADEARVAAEQFNAIKRKNDLEKLDTFLADGQNLELLALDNYADKLRKWTAAERDIQDALRADESISVKEKRLKLKELEKQETQYYDDYLDLFKASKPRLSSGKP